MKNFIIAVLFAVSLALGVLVFQQQKQLGQAQKLLAETEKKLQEKPEAAEQIAQAQRKSDILQETLVQTSAFADEKSKQAEQLQKTLAAKTNAVNPMAAMFKDPKMRDLIKSQQKAVLGPMLEKQYAALFQQLNLNAEESAQLKNLLLSKTLAGADAGMSLMDDTMDDAKRLELGKQIKAQTDDYDAQIKQFLGDSYPAYQSYEKTVPDRMTVSQFGDQLSGSTAMNADQQQQLVQVMSEARTSFKWTTDYNNQNPPNGDYATMFSEDKIAKFTQEKEQFDQQFLARAQQILSPEQARAFEEFQATQRQLQIAGMKMAAQMFAPKGQ